MPEKYQIFCDDMSGMTWCHTLGGETIEECVSAIHNGVASVRPSKCWMYYIYVLHQEKVPYWGAKPDVYKLVKGVAGSERKVGLPARRGLDYALTIWQDGWLFTDKMWRN